MHMLYTARLEKCEGLWVWSVIEATAQGLLERARGVHEKAETAALLASAALRLALVVDGVDALTAEVGEIQAVALGQLGEHPQTSLGVAQSFDPVHMGC